MEKIDISKWKGFQIKDFCVTERKGKKLQVPTGAWMAKKKLKKGDIPRITVSNYNNGITGFYEYSNDSDYRVFSNFISVSFLGTVFYQPNEASLDMKVHCIKPIDIDLNIYTASFLVSIIRKSITNYAYNDQLSSAVLSELMVKLPSTSDGSPDWKFMESCMRETFNETNESLDILRKADYESNVIDTSKWKRFHLYDDGLFEIDMGSKLDRVKMTSIKPSVFFVGRANTSNGVTGFVDAIEGKKPYSAGNLTISLGGEYLGSCFVQPNPFYTSQNVVVLIPKWDMSFEVKQFIATMIFRESRTRYKAFIDELNRHVKTDFSFLLPVTKNGHPDWSYMESYMRNVFKKARVSLDSLSGIAN